MGNIPNLESDIAEKIKRYCTENGLVCTSHRLLVASKLQELDRYADAVSLWLQLKKEKHPISINSVYLSLKLLVNAGVSSVRKSKKRQWKYRIKRDIAT